MTHFLSHWNVSPPTSPFDSLRYVLSPRPACWDAAAFKQNYRFSSNVLVSVFFAQYSITCISFRFCSSVWLRFAHARLIVSVVLWPRGLTTLSLRTDRLVFVRRCGFVSLLPALSRPSSCGPVALLHCPSVPAVSFLIFRVASCRSCPPYRVRRPVAPWPSYLVPPYRPSRFCSSVWLRFAPARLIASVVLWPRGLTNLSLRTARFSPLVVSRPPVIFYILWNSTLFTYSHY